MIQMMARRQYLSCAILTALLLFPSTCVLAQAPQPAPTPQRERELPKPTNLQVLPKDISSQDLKATMHGFTGSLGVHCTFCHVQNAETHHPDFASDAKPEKSSARIMIRMTQEINAKYLAQIPEHGDKKRMNVSCGTCHRGSSTPTEFIPPPENHAPPPPPK